MAAELEKPGLGFIEVFPLFRTKYDQLDARATREAYPCTSSSLKSSEHAIELSCLFPSAATETAVCPQWRAFLEGEWRPTCAGRVPARHGRNSNEPMRLQLRLRNLTSTMSSALVGARQVSAS